MVKNLEPMVDNFDLKWYSECPLIQRRHICDSGEDKRQVNVSVKSSPDSVYVQVVYIYGRDEPLVSLCRLVVEMDG
jgi:hypothetical protein